MKSKNSKKSKSIKLSGMKGCTVNFGGAAPGDNDGANDYSRELALLGATLRELCFEKTFDISSAISLSRSLDLEPSHITAWWNQWIKAQIKAGNIEEIGTCYSSPLYRFKV